MDSVKSLYLDPCEWNPTANRPCYYGEEHSSADVIVGANGQWRLCEGCASLQKFKHFRKRKPINKLGVSK